MTRRTHTLARCVACATLLMAAALLTPRAAVAEEPIRLTEYFEIEGHRFPVFIEIYLTPESQTRIAAKVAGNIRSIQVNLPGLLSEVVDETCQRRIALQLDSAVPETDHVRLKGRVQIALFACNGDEDYDSRRRRFSNVTDVDVLLFGGIENNCLRAYLEELTIQPSGLVGGVMSLFNLTERVSATLRDELNDTINEEELCLELPPPLVALNTHIGTGGFRDFGNGHLGFVVKGHAELTAAGVIEVIGMLPEPEPCDCR